MNNFTEINNKDTVKIAPWLLNADYKKNILKVLKNKYEGICSKFGYIKQNSIELLSVHKGFIELSTFHGYVLFEIEFNASICNPSIGSIVKCKVKNINAFGLLCTSGIIEQGKYHNILNIIIPKQDSQFTNDPDVLQNISINDEINVEILGKKYILNNTNINVFGKVIDSKKTNESLVMTDNELNVLELDDDEVVNEDNDDILEDDEEIENEEDDKTEQQSLTSEEVDDIDNDTILSEENLSEEEDDFN
tara:strand:- start:606 stop:1352 length:747 start_codon:yes stop_codon:yes gene_type:complete